MAAVTITLTDTCPSNDHIVLAVTGDRQGTIRLHVDDILGQTLDNETLLEFLTVYLKIFSSGKTRLQVRNALLAGLDIVI